MCNQTVSLIAAELERHGISTVCVILLRRVAEAVRPPRALSVPYRHGLPLGAAGDVKLQKHVIRAALRLLESTTRGPLLVDFEP